MAGLIRSGILSSVALGLYLCFTSVGLEKKLLSTLGVLWQVTIIGRSEEDEILLLASDGLWDVLTNQEAVNLAQRCLRRAQVGGRRYNLYSTAQYAWSAKHSGCGV